MRSCWPRPLCWSERSPRGGVLIAPNAARFCKRKATACRALIDARAGDLHHARHLREVLAQQRVERIGAARARPAITSLIASAVDLSGTCTMSRPVRLARYAIDRCVALPLPAEA